VSKNGAYVDAAGVRTYYEDEGSGEPLLLLHGGMVTIETWENQRGPLAERYHVYLPERRGHGRSPDVAGPTGYELMAADTAAFMQALDIESAHLVGWSDGGNVALELALARPELVRKTVLIGAAAHVDGSSDDSREWVNSLAVDSLPTFLSEPYSRLSPDGPEHLPVVAEKTITMWRTQPAHAMSELAAITSPTLILIGDNDGVTIEHAAQMLRAIPKAQLAVIPGADHGVMFDKPEIVNKLILDFLGELPELGLR
jgi:pimeloyl-ACP methyl ester carboxylesterase